MLLSDSDKIDVFQPCSTCFGEKVIKDASGSTSECSNCGGKGEVSLRVSLHDLAVFMIGQLPHEIRLRTGMR